MAYIQKQEDEQQTHADQQITSGPTDVNIQSVGQQTPNTAQVNASQSSTAPQRSGMRFADLRRYVEANRPQATQLATKVAGDIEQRAEQQVGGARTQAMGDFRQQVEQATKPVEQFAKVGEYFKAPEQNVQKAQEVAQVRKMQYAGPQQIGAEGLANIQSAAEQAKQRAELAKTQEGQRTLLRDVIPGGRYTSGMSAFDTMLLQGNPEARQQLQDVSARVSERYGKAGQAALTESQAAAEAAKGQFAAGREGLEQTIQGALAQGRAPLSAAEQALEAATIKGYADAEQFLKTGDTRFLTGEARNVLGFGGGATGPGAMPDQASAIAQQIQRAKQLGIDADVMPYFQGMTPEQVRAQIGTGNVGTAEQRARLSALEQLAGTQSTLGTPFEQAGRFNVAGAGEKLGKGITHQEKYNQYMDEYNKGQLVRQNVIPPSTEPKVQAPKGVVKLTPDDANIVRQRIVQQLARSYESNPRDIRLPPALEKAIQYGMVDEKNFLQSTAENTSALEGWADSYKVRDVDNAVMRYEKALKQEQDEIARQKANADIIRRNAEIEQKLQFLGMPSQKTDFETKPKTLVLGQMLGNQVQNLVKGV